MNRYILAITALLLATTACTKSSNTLKYGVDKSETFVTNLETEPPSLDWQKSTDTTSNEIISNIMDGLTFFDWNDPDLKPVPALATKWSSDKSLKIWTFELRQGVKWTDGVEFEAQQVVDGWERLLNPKTAAEYAYFLFPLKNAKAYNEGKIKDFSQVGIKAVDKYKIVVELDKPISFFPSMLPHHSTYPIRKDLIEKYGDSWTSPEHMVSLGAYDLKKWEHDDSILLQRNDNYWGQKAKTKYVLDRMITEASSAINAFDAGELDMVPELPSNDLEVLKKRKEFMSEPELALYFYAFNIKVKPLDNVLVRKAIIAAIDKAEIVKVMNGGQAPGTSWIPNGMMGHDDTLGIQFDPAQAKKYLEQAGYKDPSKLPPISILFNTNENHQKIGENVQAQLKRNLGINIELKNEEWKVLLDKYKTKTGYSIYRLGWYADYPDPDNFMNLMTSYSENNHSNWGNPKYDKLIEQGVSEPNIAKRKSIYKEAQKILLEDDAVAIPLYTYMKQNLVSSRVRGYKMNPLDQKIYKEIYLVGANKQ